MGIFSKTAEEKKEERRKKEEKERKEEEKKEQKEEKKRQKERAKRQKEEDALEKKRQKHYEKLKSKYKNKAEFDAKMEAHREKYEPLWLKDIEKEKEESSQLKTEAVEEVANLQSGKISNQKGLEKAQKKKSELKDRIEQHKETIKEQRNKVTEEQGKGDVDDSSDRTRYIDKANGLLDDSEKNLNDASSKLTEFKVDGDSKEYKSLKAQVLKEKFEDFKGSDLQKLVIHAKKLKEGRGNSNQGEQTTGLDKASEVVGKGLDAYGQPVHGYSAEDAVNAVKDTVDITGKLKGEEWQKANGWAGNIKAVGDIVGIVKNVVAGLKGLYDVIWGKDSGEKTKSRWGGGLEAGATLAEGILTAVSFAKGIFGPIAGLLGNIKNMTIAVIKLMKMRKNKGKIKAREEALKEKIKKHIEHRERAKNRQVNSKQVEKEASKMMSGEGREERILDKFEGKDSDGKDIEEQYKNAKEDPNSSRKEKSKKKHEITRKVARGYVSKMMGSITANKEKKDAAYYQAKLEEDRLEADELAELMYRQSNIKRARIKDFILEVAGCVSNIAGMIEGAGVVDGVGQLVALVGNLGYKAGSGVGKFFKMVFNTNRSGRNKQKFRTTYAVHMYEQMTHLFPYAEAKDSDIRNLIEDKSDKRADERSLVLNTMVSLETKTEMMGVSVDNMTDTESVDELIEKLSEAFGVGEDA